MNRPSTFFLVAAIFVVATVFLLAKWPAFTPAVQPEQTIPLSENHSDISKEVENSVSGDLEPEIFSSVFPTESQPIEFLQSIDLLDRDDREAALTAAEEFMIEIDPDWVTRWRPVVVDPLVVFRDRSIRLSGGPSREPIQLLYLSLFKDILFTIENTRFVDEGSRAIWFGKIVEGGSGTVTISLAHDDETHMDAYINIASNYGNFNIAPTKSRPFYVVTKANPYIRVKID